MKSLRQPKDGKTFCVNGRRFQTMDEVHKYAADRNMFVSNFEKVGLFTMCDLTAYEAVRDSLSQAEIIDIYRPL